MLVWILPQVVHAGLCGAVACARHLLKIGCTPSPRDSDDFRNSRKYLAWVVSVRDQYSQALSDLVFASKTAWASYNTYYPSPLVCDNWA